MEPARDSINQLSMEVERSRRMSRMFLIAARYKRGDKVNKIAEEFECSTHTILRIARTMGLKKRSKSDDPNRHRRIIEMSKQNPRPSGLEIARACNCSVALVSKVEKVAGLRRYHGTR